MPAPTAKKLDLVFAELERRILGQVWKVGDQIPTEEALSAEFSCSRSTVGKAIARLEHGGLVARRTRAGTHVISNTSNRQPSPLHLDACAFVYPSDQHEGVWRSMRGFQDAAHEAARRALLVSTGADIGMESQIISRLGEFDVKGAVIFPMVVSPQTYPQYREMIASCRFPIVLVEVNLPETQRPAVVVDGFDAGYTMTRHLLARGLRKVGFLANYAWVATTRDKHQGYRRAMTEAGLDAESYVRLEPEMHPRYDDPLHEPTEMATAYLRAHRDVQGVVCSSDFLAKGVLRAAAALRLRVPKDLRVAGMDDFAFAAESELTTYRIPYEEMGRRAFGLVNDLMAGKATSGEVYLRGELIARKSG